MSDTSSSETLRGKKVLIVEDEAFVAFDLMDALDRVGAEGIGPAMSLEQASDIVAQGDADGAILDVSLRGKSIEPFAGALRDKGIPFIFHTGLANLPDMAARFPKTPIFPKPAAPDQLVASLAKVMD